MGNPVALSIVKSDVAEVEADLLLLKYARRLFGADEMIVSRLANAGVAREGDINPAEGDFVSIETQGAIASRRVLFLGTPALRNFRYKEMRVFAARAISLIDEQGWRHDAYLVKLLAGRNITHFYSSEFYGDHVSKALGAVDRRVDAQRQCVPISGTQIRDDPFRYRAHLDVVVYRDLITKVVFLGAPSTGKTTLARELAKRHNTVWMPEYGREYWEANQQNRRLTLEQLVEIATQHRCREDALLLQANEFLFIDTDATTTYQFSLDYHGEAHPALEQLASDAVHRYDIFFLCQTDIPYDDTADRSGEVHREVFQRQIEADLIHRRTPFVHLGGNLDRRLEAADEVLKAFEKFNSNADRLQRHH